jgi:hypothetical protein
MNRSMEVLQDASLLKTNFKFYRCKGTQTQTRVLAVKYNHPDCTHTEYKAHKSRIFLSIPSIILNKQNRRHIKPKYPPSI